MFTGTWMRPERMLFGTHARVCSKYISVGAIIELHGLGIISVVTMARLTVLGTIMNLSIRAGFTMIVVTSFTG